MTEDWQKYVFSSCQLRILYHRDNMCSDNDMKEVIDGHKSYLFSFSKVNYYQTVRKVEQIAKDGRTYVYTKEINIAEGMDEKAASPKAHASEVSREFARVRQSSYYFLALGSLTVISAALVSEPDACLSEDALIAAVPLLAVGRGGGSVEPLVVTVI